VRVPDGSPTKAAPVLLAAVVTTTWAAVLTFAPVLLVVTLVWLIDGQGAAGAAVRFAAAGWLLGHGVPLGTGAGPVGLTPLLVTAFAAWRVMRAGAHTARAVVRRRRPSMRVAALVGVCVGGVYGGLGAVTALAGSMPGLDIPVGRAAVTLFVIGTAVALFGAARETGAYPKWWARLPEPVRDGVRTGLVGALLVLAAGAATAGVAIAVTAGEATDMLRSYHAGVAGQAGLTLVCLLYAPTVATWAAAYLLGPGFAIGSGTAVSLVAVHLGPLPALPILSGLPSAPANVLAGLLLGVPLVAAMVAGWRLARYRSESSWTALLGAAALAGPVGGLALALAARAAAGPLGAGRLADVGPVTWEVGLAGTVVIAAGTLLAAAATRLLRRRTT